MKQFSQVDIGPMRATLLAALLCGNVGIANGSPSSDEQALSKGAFEDVTPQQKYSTAIREAGGAYKEWLRECIHGPAEARRVCSAEAKATYDRDMTRAKLIVTTR